MCTLCLCDMGPLRDEWLREPKATPKRAELIPAAPALLPLPQKITLPVQGAIPIFDATDRDRVEAVAA